MARIRSVKPEFFTDEDLQDLEIANPGAYVMLVFEALWNHSDKRGVFQWNPRILKLSILPFINYDLSATLKLLADAGFIRIFEHAGKSYGHVVKFLDHQRITGEEAKQKARYPAPFEEPEEAADISQGSSEEAGEQQEGSSEEAGEQTCPALGEGKGKGKGKGGGEEFAPAREEPPPTVSEHGQAKIKDLKDLVEEYGRALVTEYLAKVEASEKSKGKVHADRVATVRLWLLQDKDKIKNRMPKAKSAKDRRQCPVCEHSLAGGVCSVCGYQTGDDIKANHDFYQANLKKRRAS